MPPRSAVERSSHRDEIDDLLLEGMSPRKVSDYLKNTYDESISHTAINNYKKNKLNVKEEIAIKYQEKKTLEKKNIKVKKGLDDLEKLDDFINQCHDVKLDHDSLYADEKTSKLDIEKHKLNVKKAGAQGIKIKSDILRDDPVPPDVNVNLVSNDLNDFFKKQREVAIKKTIEENDSK